MRLKIIIVVLLAGLAGIGSILLLKQSTSQPPTVVAENPVKPPTVAVANPPPNASLPKTTVTPTPVPTAVTTVLKTNLTTAQPQAIAVNTNEVRAAKIQAIIDQLHEWQAADDKASLKSILNELKNPEKEIRLAAIEAAIQFGDRSAIPQLKELANVTTDAEERQALLDAVEFMSLPTMTEVREANGHPSRPQIPPPQ
jgi:hypothetical protein